MKRHTPDARREMEKTFDVSHLTPCDPFMKLKRRVRDKLNKCKDVMKIKLCDRILNDTG